MIFINKHDYQVSTSLMTENKTYKRLIKNFKTDFYSVASSRAFSHGQISWDEVQPKNVFYFITPNEMSEDNIVAGHIPK